MQKDVHCGFIYKGEREEKQCSCLENFMDRGAWQATYSPWGRKESDTTEQLTQTHNLEGYNVRGKGERKGKV